MKNFNNSYVYILFLTCCATNLFSSISANHKALSQKIQASIAKAEAQERDQEKDQKTIKKIYTKATSKTTNFNNLKAAYKENQI